MLEPWGGPLGSSVNSVKTLSLAPVFLDSFRDWVPVGGEGGSSLASNQISAFVIWKIFFPVTSTLWKDKKLMKLNPNIKWKILILIPSFRRHEAKTLIAMKSLCSEENWNQRYFRS